MLRIMRVAYAIIMQITQVVVNVVLNLNMQRGDREILPQEYHEDYSKPPVNTFLSLSYE